MSSTIQTKYGGLRTTIPQSLSAGVKSSIVNVNLRSFGTFPDLVGMVARRTLQCCNASFAMSAINFWDAIDINLILKNKNQFNIFSNIQKFAIFNIFPKYNKYFTKNK